MLTTEPNVESSATARTVLNKVREQLAALGAPGIDYGALDPAALLIDDVGLDSLKFVDLTVRLEEAFGLDEFPMQEWIDEQLAAGKSLTVGELARACETLLR